LVKAFVDGGQEFEGKAEPGLTGEDCIGGIERGREGLADSSETMECNAGRVGVGNVVMVEGVGDDDGCGTFITREKEAEVVKREEVGREARVRKSEEVIERVGVAHDRKEEWKQCRKRG